MKELLQKAIDAIYEYGKARLVLGCRAAAVRMKRPCRKN